MTLNQLKKLCLEWQKRLALTEWNIEVSYGKAADMKFQGDLCDGLSSWSTENSIGWISILRTAKNKELILIHELAHIRLEGYAPKSDHYSPTYEMGLTRIAQALLACKNIQFISKT